MAFSVNVPQTLSHEGPAILFRAPPFVRASSVSLPEADAEAAAPLIKVLVILGASLALWAAIAALVIPPV